MHSFTRHQYIITPITRLITHLFTDFLAKAEIPDTPEMLLDGCCLPDLYLLSGFKYMLE